MSPPVLDIDRPLASFVEAMVTSASPQVECAVERRSKLSRREFEHDYSLPRRPVILTDATQHWKARHWTPEVLKRRVGRREIEFRGGQGKIPFDDLTDMIEASHHGAPAPYARNIHLFRDLPELAADISPRIAYCQPDWKSSRLMPKNWLFDNGLEEMFFGGQGSKFPTLHVDYWGMDAFISQLYGDKEVLVFAPSDTPYLYPTAQNPLISSIADFDAPDLARFPLYAKAKPIRFTLHPGETLFCPGGWWHTTAMPDISITIVTANWGRGNWAELIRQYEYHRRGGVRVKAILTKAYLQAVGVALTCRDRLVHGI
ncbi:MAG TPA: cupin-like domain-containing protein [Pirellulaceae bacterium]|nr:cupin-like domain-containing protein [Pirellulaceae bacterium]